MVLSLKILVRQVRRGRAMQQWKGVPRMVLVTRVQQRERERATAADSFGKQETPKKRKTTTATLDTVLRRSPRIRGLTLPSSPPNERAVVRSKEAAAMKSHTSVRHESDLSCQVKITPLRSTDSLSRRDKNTLTSKRKICVDPMEETFSGVRDASQGDMSKHDEEPHLMTRTVSERKDIQR